MRSDNPTVPTGTVFNAFSIVEVMRTKLIDHTQFSPVVIERHAGEFSSMDELMRYVHQGASIRIAALDYGDVTTRRDPRADVLWAAYVVCQNVGQIPADILAEVITGRVTELVGIETWGLSQCDKSTHIQAKNLYNTNKDKHGLSAWVVTWTQRMLINQPITVVDLDDFLRANLTQIIAPDAPTNDAYINVRGDR